MNKMIGFIGCGNMATSMIEGIIKSKFVDSKNIIVSNKSEEKLIKAKEKYGVMISTNNKDVGELSDIIILSVKPNKYKDVLVEIKDVIKKNTIIVSIAAGIDMSFIERCFENDIKVVRTMPNTPSLVMEGMTAICSNSNVNEVELEYIKNLFLSFGQVEEVEERLMDSVPALSGSSPAWVYMMIEALGDGAVLQGFSREQAYKMAAQTVLGAAKMVLQSGEHPAVLKDKVCSPGGTTIESVYSLEKNGFRGTIIEAMDECTKKAKYMSKKNN